MATIQKRVGKNGAAGYRVMLRRKGFPARYATFKRLSDAKTWAQRAEGNIVRGRRKNQNAGRERTASDLIERYLEILRLKKTRAYPKQKQLLNWWKAQLGARSLSHLTPAVISKKRDALLAENVGTADHPKHRSPATANRYLASLSKACTIAVKRWHWLQDNPLARVQKEHESPGRLRYLSSQEKDALLIACGESLMLELKLIVTLAVTTGMRRGEIKTLRWQDIDFKRGSIMLQKTANGKSRAVPIAAPALALLGKHAQVRRLHTDLVFPRGDKDRPLDFDHAFIEAVHAAKIENFRFHDLRHTAASYLAMSGATTAEIAAVLGHKTLAMAKRYSHLSGHHTGAVVERMTNQFFQ